MVRGSKRNDLPFPGDGGRFKEEEFTVSQVMMGGLKKKDLPFPR